MSVLSTLLGGIPSLIGGGITGLVGTAISSVYTYKSKQLDIDLEKQKALNEIELRKLDIQAQAQEIAAQAQIAQIQAQGEVDKADAVSFNTSQTNEPQRYATGMLTSTQNWLMVILDFFRGLIRPSLTVYLILLTSLIYFQAKALIGSGMTADDAVTLTSKIVDTVLYLTSTVILWWFGSRAHDKKENS